MADKHFDSSIKYGDNASSGGANAFAAAAYSLNMSNLSPFQLPYYNPGLFFNQNGYSPAVHNFSNYPLWQSFPVTPEYMMNITALQNIQTMAAAAAANNRESFYDVLNKISQTPSFGNDEKDFLSKFPASAPSNRIAYSPTQTPLYQHMAASAVAAAGADATAANRPSSSRTCASTPFANAQLSCASSPSSTNNNASHNFNLATLAEVASSMTPEAPVRSVTSIKSPTFVIDTACPPVVAAATTTTTAATDIDDVKSVKQEQKRCNNGVKSTGSRKRHRNAKVIDVCSVESNVNNNNKMAKQSSTKSVFEQSEKLPTVDVDATVTGGNVNNGFPQLDQNLLNASAMAYLALYFNPQSALKKDSLNETIAMLDPKTATQQRVDDNNKIDRSAATTANVNNRSKPKRAYRRRSNQTSSAVSGGDVAAVASDKAISLDLVDETVNEVIRLVCSSTVATCSKSRKRQKPGLPNPTSSNDAIKAKNSAAICCNGNSTWTEHALDLTVKKEMRSLQSIPTTNEELRAPVQKDNRTENDFAVGKSILEKNNTGRSVRKSRRVAVTDMVRVPLTKGWRRQTCIRGYSPSGIRGDVIYYAPCGRKLASCGEVLRYLKKHQDNEISRDHFSFSSKVLVGEFLLVNKPNDIRSITEDDVRRIVQKEAQQKVARSNSSRHINSINAAACCGVDTSSSVSNYSLCNVETAVYACVNDLIDNVSDSMKSLDSGHVAYEYCREFHSEFNGDCRSKSNTDNDGGGGGDDVAATTVEYSFCENSDVVEPNNNIHECTKFVDENSSSKLDETVDGNSSSVGVVTN